MLLLKSIFQMIKTDLRIKSPVTLRTQKTVLTQSQIYVGLFTYWYFQQN